MSTKPDEIPLNHKLALRLEMACEAFETLRDIITGSIKINVEARPRVPFATIAALAQSFVANTARAHRILEHSKGKLPVPEEKRRAFLATLQKVVDVRDVNEHGFDAINVSSKPKLHNHGGGFVDETSLVIEGPQMIFMGPLNLAETYKVVASMREIAGFASLPQELPPPPK